MPVAGGVSLFFFLPPDLFGAGLSVVFAVDFVLEVFLSEVFFVAGFLLADFFLVDFFSGAGSTVSTGTFVCSNVSVKHPCDRLRRNDFSVILQVTIKVCRCPLAK